MGEGLTHRTDPLLAAHERAAPEGDVERARPDGRAGTRGESRADHPLHQAGAARHRRAGAGEKKVSGTRPSALRTMPRRRSSTTWLTSWASRSFIAANATPRSPTSPRKWTSSSTPGASRASARKGPRPPKWAGARTRRNCRRSLTNTPKGRETKSAWHAWASTRASDLGPAGPRHHGMVVRHGEAFTMSDKLDGLGGRQGRLPPDGPLRVLSLRRGDRLARRAARSRLRPAAEDAHHDRRDHQRGRHPWRSRDGPCLSVVVVRIGSRHRGIAATGAASERHDDAGRHLRRGCLYVDDRQPSPRHCASPTICRTTSSWTSASPISARSCRCRRTGRR